MALTRLKGNQVDQTTDASAIDLDLVAIGKLEGIGFLKKTAVNTWALDTTISNIIPAQTFASLTGKPTTLTGYNISDAYTKTQIDSSLAGKQASGPYLTAITSSNVKTAMVGTGAVIQTVNSTVAAATSNTVLALSNTLPTISAGTQIWTASVIPTATTSKIQVRGAFTFVSGTASKILMAYVFRGSTCIGSFGASAATIAQPYPIVIDLIDSPATISSTQYTIRVAVTSAATWYINQFATAYFGGTLASSNISLLELA